MRTTNLDPTAGETARAIRLDPDAIHRVGDPMDPHYGDPSRVGAGDEARIFDPTSPVCGGPPPSA
jgi:hypothetical protein